MLLDAPARPRLGALARDRACATGSAHRGVARRQRCDAGELPDAAVRPLAHVLIGALDEAALYVARADDPDAARAEVGAVLNRAVALARRLSA